MQRTRTITKFRFVFLGLFVLGVLLTPTSFAHAGFFSFLTDPVGKAANFIALLISWIGSFLIAVGAFLIQFGLSLSMKILNSDAVRIGYNVTLSLANLGFVLGIIIIGIATILRMQTYGVQQTLRKLIVMAIVVNFGLVIAGTILNFSDQLAMWFMRQSVPGFSDDSMTINQFTQKLTSAFKPQGLLETPEEKTSTADDLSMLTKALLNILFTAAMSIIIAITMIAIAVMLLMRFFWISILLVLLPLAWLGYVFPILKGQFDKWWSKFIHWAFYAPLVLFFIYLAMMVAFSQQKGTGSYVDQIAGTVINNANSQTNPAAAIQTFTNLKTGVIGTIAGQLIVVGLAIGGLFAANSVGMVFAGTAIGWAKSTGNWATGKLKTGAKKAVPSRALQKTSTALQGVGANRAWPLRKLSAPIRWLGKAAGGASRATGEGVFKDYQKKAGDLSRQQILDQIPAARGTELMAFLEKAKKENFLTDALGKIPKDDLKKRVQEGNFNAYGQKKLFDDIYKEGMVSTAELHKLTTMIDEGRGTEMVKDEKGLLGEKGGLVQAAKLFEKASDEFVKSIGKGDLKKLALNDFFKGDKIFDLNEGSTKRLREQFSRSIANAAPQLASGILPNLKGDQLDKFTKTYSTVLAQDIKAIEGKGGGLSSATRKEIIEKYTNLRKEAPPSEMSREDYLTKLNNDMEKELDKIEHPSPSSVSEEDRIQLERLKKNKKAFDRSVFNNLAYGTSEEEEDKGEKKGGEETKEKPGSENKTT